MEADRAVSLLQAASFGFFPYRVELFQAEPAKVLSLGTHPVLNIMEAAYELIIAGL